MIAVENQRRLNSGRLAFRRCADGMAGIVTD
jgi:hypothetical protein